ncbi:MAG: GH3 auxin-responsive promoter family protein [Phycisphaerales bacterium]|nr:GH3 auxin-responsive promoter family protein [Phycisphaerales bacterium]
MTPPARGRWTGLVGLGLRAALSRRIALLSDRAYWATNSGRLQARQLQRLIALSKHTSFGREHGFHRLAHLRGDDLLRAYRAQTPIREYLRYAPYITRMRDHAEPDVCWPGVVLDWAQTSGTTAGDKFMPVSRDLLRHNFRASMDIFAHAHRMGVDLRRLFAGRILFLGGSTDLAVNRHGLRTGDLSGLVTPMIKWPLSEVYLPGKRIALMSDWKQKIDAMAAACLDQDVRAVSGMASWGLVLFTRALEMARERGRDVRTLRELWPNMDLFIHGGVNYTPFRPRVQEVWSGGADDVPHRLEVYPASEAFVAMQDEPGDAGLRLCADHGVFFEFVPVEEIHRPDPVALTCDRVEPGVRYVVVLSTPGGLFRYILGDVVEFDTIPPAGPARLRIVGRHKHFINAFGENLIVEHIEKAVARAADQAALTVGEFTAAPVYPDPVRGVRAGLELAVEIASGAPSDALRRFRDAFDGALKDQNVDYTTKRRDDLGMAPPTVTPIPPGAFHAWMESRGKLGGQHKCPRCANHRDIIDAVLQTASART